MKNNLSYVFFIIFTVLVFAFIMKLIAPFALIMFFACVFYVVLKPLYKKILGKKEENSKIWKTKKVVLSVVFAFLSLIIFLVPLSLLAYATTTQLLDLANITYNFFSHTDIAAIIEKFEIEKILSKLPINITVESISQTIKDEAINMASTASKYVTVNIAALIKNTGTFITSFIFMMFSLFFFFMDGEYIGEELVKALPIEDKYVKRLFKAGTNAIQGIIYGNLFTGIFQAVCGFIVFTIFKIDNAILFASLLVVASFIPIVGTSIIWVPLGVVLGFKSGIFMGVLFIVVSALAITLPDNFIRPLLLGNRISLHPLFIFFSILGGILSFGLAGIILGPLSVILFFELMKIFNELRNVHERRPIRHRYR